jgi:hypothetical protein
LILQILTDKKAAARFDQAAANYNFLPEHYHGMNRRVIHRYFRSIGIPCNVLSSDNSISQVHLRYMKYL